MKKNSLEELVNGLQQSGSQITECNLISVLNQFKNNNHIDPAKIKDCSKEIINIVNGTSSNLNIIGGKTNPHNGGYNFLLSNMDHSGERYIMNIEKRKQLANELIKRGIQVPEKDKPFVGERYFLKKICGSNTAKTECSNIDIPLNPPGPFAKGREIDWWLSNSNIDDNIEYWKKSLKCDNFINFGFAMRDFKTYLNKNVLNLRTYSILSSLCFSNQHNNFMSTVNTDKSTGKGEHWIYWHSCASQDNNNFLEKKEMLKDVVCGVVYWCIIYIISTLDSIKDWKNIAYNIIEYLSDIYKNLDNLNTSNSTIITFELYDSQRTFCKTTFDESNLYSISKKAKQFNESILNNFASDSFQLQLQNFFKRCNLLSLDEIIYKATCFVCEAILINQESKKITQIIDLIINYIKTNNISNLRSIHFDLINKIEKEYPDLFTSDCNEVFESLGVSIKKIFINLFNLTNMLDINNLISLKKNIQKKIIVCLYTNSRYLQEGATECGVYCLFIAMCKLLNVSTLELGRKDLNLIINDEFMKGFRSLIFSYTS